MKDDACHHDGFYLTFCYANLHRKGHCALVAIVCLSVCPMPDPKSRTEGRSKLKIGRKEAHDAGDA